MSLHMRSWYTPRTGGIYRGDSHRYNDCNEQAFRCIYSSGSLDHTPRSSTGTDAKVKDGIETIIRRFTQSDYLYDGNWAQKNLGLSRPLLRKNPPIGREATFYSSLKVDETSYWVCSKWMPNQKARLTRFVNKLSEKAGE